MTLSQILSLILGAFLFLFFQIYLMSYIVIYDVAICFIFILFLFMLPVSIPAGIEFLIGFFMGLLVDVAGNTYGVNASAVLCALAVKRMMISATASTGIRETGNISLNNQNFVWYITYLLTLIFVHHTAFFLLESFTFQHFGYTLLKIVASTIYSFIVNYIICVTFYKK